MMTELSSSLRRGGGGRRTRLYLNNNNLTLIILFLLIIIIPSSTPLGGTFSLRLRSFLNPRNRDATPSHLCCNPNESDCRTPCSNVKFRVCVKNYQVNIDASAGSCYFGEKISEVMRNPKDMNEEMEFGFGFRWPGTFSLIIEAMQVEGNLTSTSSLNSRPLATLAIQQYLDPSSSWKTREWKGGDEQRLVFDYRIQCLSDYYGEACDKMCKGRDDKFGHYRCDKQTGERVCMDGWEGDYCERAICSPGCSTVHGTCSVPHTCVCHTGWEGPTCNSCSRYPGCKHGRCIDKPFQCECEEGWGGLFCNQDLNYCTNHKPCRNGGTCFNTGQGSFTCECPEDFEGLECEVVKRLKERCVCEHGGVCRDNGTATFCICPDSHTGLTCSTPKKPVKEVTSPHNITICHTSPCVNGGTCSVSSETPFFTCTCPPGFYGNDCSERCHNTTCELLFETQELREELSTQHVLLVVIVSVATPVMVVVAVGVVLLLKRRKEEERRRIDEMARKQNEENVRKTLSNKNVNNLGVTTRNSIVKVSNLDLSRSSQSNSCSPNTPGGGGGNSPPLLRIPILQSSNCSSINFYNSLRDDFSKVSNKVNNLSSGGGGGGGGGSSMCPGVGGVTEV